MDFEKRACRGPHVPKALGHGHLLGRSEQIFVLRNATQHNNSKSCPQPPESDFEGQMPGTLSTILSEWLNAEDPGLRGRAIAIESTYIDPLRNVVLGPLGRCCADPSRAQLSLPFSPFVHLGFLKLKHRKKAFLIPATSRSNVLLLHYIL